MLDHDDAEELDPLQQTRKKLRDELLVSIILDKEKTEFTATFDGYGDSGEVHADTGNKKVDEFLESCVTAYVTTDWYNGDGGGGDITWKVFDDKIIINSHYNEMVSNEDMVGVEI